MKREKSKKRRYGWAIALAVVVCIAGFIGYMALNACVVHLRRATVRLDDLPAAFEGKTILYAADIDLGGVNTAKRAADLFERLQVLQPDMLLLGGDYTAPTLTDLINQSDPAHYAANTANVRRDFFLYIKDFRADLGRYVLAAPDDALAGDMTLLSAEAGFRLLGSGAAEIRLGEDRMYVVGLDGGNTDIPKIASRFKSKDCVIALANSPTRFPAITTAEASDNGHWADLVLAGHTHAGQILAFGQSILSLDALEQQFIYGWNRETGVPMLVTSGVGCEGVNLRLGTGAEVWLITLTGGQGE